MSRQPARYALKPFHSPQHAGMNWAVTGPSARSLGRWRKLFATREEAELFLRQRSAELEEVNSPPGSHPAANPELDAAVGAAEAREPLEKRRRKKTRFRRADTHLLFGVLFIVLLAFLTDRFLRTNLRRSPPGILLAADFESNPILSGWTAATRGTDWSSVEHASGARSILIASGDWSGPSIGIQPAQWYRVSFQSKSGAAMHELDSQGRCALAFLDQDGVEISHLVFGAVSRSQSWRRNEFLFESPLLSGTAPKLPELRLKLRFPGQQGQALFIDDVVVEQIGSSRLEENAGTRAQATRAPTGSRMSELLAAAAQFQLDHDESPILGETFRTSSQFHSDETPGDGDELTVPERVSSPLTYQFPEALDARAGEITVYWAFRANQQAGHELCNVLNFTDAPPRGHQKPAGIVADLRTNTAGHFYVDPGWGMKRLEDLRIAADDHRIPGIETAEKFRLRVRLSETDKVLAAIEWWNGSSRSWEPVASSGPPDLRPAVLNLSVRAHLFGHTSFRSLSFQGPPDAPKLDTVLVTRRWALRRRPEVSAAPEDGFGPTR